MDKTYHFMAGLPRSGSTVLSAILNQNPKVYSSPTTEMLHMLFTLHEAIPEYGSYKAGVFYEGYNNVLQRIPENFYAHIKKPVIIDKNRGWGTPYNFSELSPYVNKDGKMILTLRPILEVLASFIKVSKKTEKITGGVPYIDENLWVTEYRSVLDAQIDSLMQTNGLIDKAIYSIANLLKNHRERVHIVWFEDLLNAPQQTLNGIYDFLELDRWEHDFNSIKEVDKHDDLRGYSVIGLHDIGEKLKSPATDPKDYLSEYAIQKYKNALDFLDI